MGRVTTITIDITRPGGRRVAEGGLTQQGYGRFSELQDNQRKDPKGHGRSASANAAPTGRWRCDWRGTTYHSHELAGGSGCSSGRRRGEVQDSRGRGNDENPEAEVGQSDF